MRCRIGVQRDLGRSARMLHRTTEKGLGRILIAISAQKEIDRPACLVQGPIQVEREPLYRYRPSSRIHRLDSVPAPTLLELRQVALVPTQNRRVRQRDASIRHPDYHVS